MVWEEIGDIAHGLWVADLTQVGGRILIDLVGEKAVWDAEAEQAEFEARQRRGDKLLELGTLAVFAGGRAALAGSGGAPELRAVTVVVTPDRFVLLSAHPAFDPDKEVGSILRSAVVGAEAVDETGLPVGPNHLTPEAELEGHRRFAVTLSLRGPGGEGSAVFLFPAASTALEARDRFREHMAA